jgi:hypothetical protein
MRRRCDEEPVAKTPRLSRAVSAAFARHVLMPESFAAGGNDPADATRCFAACLDSMAVSLATKRVFDWQRSVDEGGPELIINAKQDCIYKAIRSCITAERERRPLQTSTVSTSVVPIGYYNERDKQGHACGVLVMIRNDIGFVAFADADPRGTATRARVVAWKKVKTFVARGLLTFMRRAHSLLTGHELRRWPKSHFDLEALRLAICRACKIGDAVPGVLQWVKLPEQDAGDTHLLVRDLAACAPGVFARTQLGKDSCSYESVFWLLCIAEALHSSEYHDVRALESLVGPDELLRNVTRVDRLIKQAVFRDLVRCNEDKALLPISRQVALVYAKCAWLDGLPATLLGITRPTPGSIPVTRQVLETKPSHASLRPPLPASTEHHELTDLASVRAWIVANDNTTLCRSKIAGILTLIHKARGVLIGPVPAIADTGKHAPAEAARDILVVAMFLACQHNKISVYTGGPQEAYLNDMIAGMMLRCARYVIAVLMNSRTAAVRERWKRDGAAALGSSFTTSLPWAAQEYYHLKDESASVSGLLFGTGNFGSAHWQGLDLPTDGALVRVEPINDVIDMETLNRRLNEENAKKKFELSRLGADHIAALDAIRGSPLVATLNVVLALRDRDVIDMRIDRFLFGFKGGSVVFLAVSVETYGARPSLDVQRVHAAQLVTDTPVNRKPRAVHMETNAENIHASIQGHLDAGEAVGAVGAAGVGLSTVQRLRLVVDYPEPTVRHAVDELARWVDLAFTHTFVYRGSMMYTLEAHVMPASRNAPDRRCIHAVRRLLSKMPHAQPIVDMIDGSFVPYDETVPGLYDSATVPDRECRYMLQYTHIACALILGMPMSSSGRGGHLDWTLTPIDVTRDGKCRRDGRNFVFDAIGGAMGVAHERLRSIKRRFDHWTEPSGGSKIECEDVTMWSTPATAEVWVRVSYNGVGDSKPRPLPVFQGESPWWDSTDGAFVVPVGEDRVTGLVVIPGRAKLDCRGYLAAWPVCRRSVDAFLSRGSFEATLDRAGHMLHPDTATGELMCVFIAYAYGGSHLGTRLMPLAATRVHEDRAAITAVLAAAPCPLALFSACALMYHLATDAEARTELKRAMRCEEHEMLYSELIGRARADGHWVSYGSTFGDSFAGFTGKHADEEQRKRVGAIIEKTGTRAVFQMITGFGKSSIVVPALVGHYLDMPHVRLVFVTQPGRLVLDATRVVGALVASHPYVGDMPLYLLSKGDAASIGTMLDRPSGLSGLPFKAVVVLSTADMQQIVRDNPVVYEASRSDAIVHIADEVDAESNPLTCEVIIAGSDTAAHYNRAIAEQPGAYYKAAFDLVRDGPLDPGVISQLEALDAMHGRDTSQPFPGKRLLAVFHATRSMQHRVRYGLSDDEDEYIAVPFSHSNVPLRGTFYTDLDASIVLLARAVLHGMRASDPARVRANVRAAFRTHARFIEEYLQRSDRMREYFATVMAMPRIRISKTELSVAFVDLLGASGTFVGFSGTLGVEIAVPTYQIDDPRLRGVEQLSIEVVPDTPGQKKVLDTIGRFPYVVVDGAFGSPRAERVLTAIKEHESFLDDELDVCIVDGCGEFGAFDDHVQSVRTAFGGEAGERGDVGYWDSSGALLNIKSRVRYYCHRDSRGVDSVMPIKTVGFIVVSLDHTTVVDAAQATGRLRMIEEGQTAVFVVVTEAGPVNAGTMSAIVPRLEANELAWNEAGRAVQQRHAEHAAIAKRSTADFERAVTYTDVVDSAQLKIAHKTQHKHETKLQHVIAAHTRGDVLVECYMASDPLGTQRTLSNTTSMTDIKVHLNELGIDFSPVLERTKAGALRRVFAVRDEAAEAAEADRRGGAEAERALVVMTVVEIWGVHADDATQRARYCVYSQEGRRIPTWRYAQCTPPAALALLGRLLCDDSLAITEEIQLLRFMSAMSDESLRAVMKCLYGTGFLSPSKTKYMPLLVSASAANVLKMLSGRPVTIIDELVAMVTEEATSAMFGATPKPHRRLFL